MCRFKSNMDNSSKSIKYRPSWTLWKAYNEETTIIDSRDTRYIAFSVHTACFFSLLFPFHGEIEKRAKGERNPPLFRVGLLKISKVEFFQKNLKCQR